MKTVLGPSILRYVGPVLFLTVALLSAPSTAQQRVEKNVVYGMYSGAALLMDVYYPAHPNGLGVITIYGNAWSGPDSYDGWQLKRLGAPEALVDAGFTAFVVNHRVAPRFHYPAAVDDVQRAVRFMRFHADRFAIDPERIGAFGASSGGYLVAMLGTLPGDGDAEDPDPVNRVSADVQAVAAHASAVDFSHPEYRGQWGPVNFLGLPPTWDFLSTFREASPVTHVSSDDAPFLLVHGAEDEIVPVETIEGMAEALSNAGVPVELEILPDTGHGLVPDYVGSARWLTRHLIGEAGIEDLEAILGRHEMVNEAVRLARTGELAAALDAVSRARADGPLSIDFLQWAVLCKNGSLGGFEQEVLDECDNAVASAPEDPYVQGILKETRAVARALVGDHEGAIRDLEAYLAYATNAVRARRTAWIQVLKNGENPFDAELLEQLRSAGGF